MKHLQKLKDKFFSVNVFSEQCASKIGSLDNSAEEFHDAKQKALRLLARREHSRQELQRKLEIAEYSRQTITAVLEQLAEQQWICDQRFAEMYIRKRMAQGCGPQRVMLELQERGISPEEIAHLLEQGESFWQEHLANVWRKRFKRPPENDSHAIKQMRFLQYKGFTISQIKLFFKQIQSK